MMMMMTRQSTSNVLSAANIAETLEKYDIAPNQLHEWEVALGLSIPTSAQGEKIYSSQHLNLFKNVKKHLTLGRNLNQIKQLIQLPAITQGVTVVKPATASIGSQIAAALAKESALPETAPPVSTNFNTAWNHSPNYTKDKLVFLELIEQPKVPPPVQSTRQPINSSQQNPTSILSPEVAPPSAAMATTFASPLREVFAASAEALVNVSHAEQYHHQSPVMPCPPAVASSAPISVPTSSPASMIDTPIQTIIPAAAPIQHGLSMPTPVEGGAVLPPIATGSTAVNHATTMQIVERLMKEKEANQRKLIEAEKLNSHLYNVNNLFNKKVKELTQMVQQLKTVANEQQNMKLMEEKSVLQRQLLDVERHKLEQQRALSQEQQKATQLAQQLENVQKQWQELTVGFNPNRFVGHWQETLLLKQKVFDTFGLNVEAQRNQHRVFDVAPTRVAGNAGFFSFEFKYPENTVWKRLEQLSLVAISSDELVGEVSVDYVLDGVIVCRAIYQASLQRV
jgi:DNA-binding transcriptional MerR regulator